MLVENDYRAIAQARAELRKRDRQRSRALILRYRRALQAISMDYVAGYSPKESPEAIANRALAKGGSRGK